MANRYSIKSMEEARQYLNHPVLGKRLLECTKAVVALKSGTLAEIFGYPDDLKFKSSMKLFEKIAGSGSVFSWNAGGSLASFVVALPLVIKTTRATIESMSFASSSPGCFYS